MEGINEMDGTDGMDVLDGRISERMNEWMNKQTNE